VDQIILDLIGVVLETMRATMCEGRGGLTGSTQSVEWWQVTLAWLVAFLLIVLVIFCAMVMWLNQNRCSVE